MSFAGFVAVIATSVQADEDVELGFLVVTYVVLVVPLVAMAVLAALRPYVAVRPGGIEIQNPFRRYQLQWSIIASVTPGYGGLSFQTTEGGAVRAWAVQKSNLATWRNQETRADRVASVIRELVRRAGSA